MTKKYSKKFPSAMQIMDGAEIDCSRVKDLDQNGLAGWMIYVIFQFTEKPEVWMTDFKWMCRKPGNKRRTLIGTQLNGMAKLKVLPEQSRAAFMRYASELEDKKMDAIVKIIEREMAAEEREEACGDGGG